MSVRGSAVALVIPVKPLQGAKQRLASVLSAADRRVLGLALAAGTVRCAVATWPPASVVLVGDDPEVGRLAARVGAAWLADAGAGQSPAVRLGFEWALAQGAEVVATAAADLPEVSPDDLGHLLSIARTADASGLWLAPDAAGTGTNALVLRPPGADVLRFGPDSLARHRAAAAALGLPVQLIDRPGLRRDCDRLEDIEALQALPPRSAAHHLLQGLAERVPAP
ncbi:MAG TPA: 2-phospho-L-lactate guanylyltransferase [Candidatus Dormibacteraeota bacterium]|nr:2-phospho-L-lactate guanylyltransferase [Candidatus Dormibacteraeota bacterium]